MRELIFDSSRFVCVTSFEAWFSGVIARILNILQTEQIQEYLGLWDWITRHPPPTPPHGGIDHRTFSTYIYIKIEIKLQKMIHSFLKKPFEVGRWGGGGVGYICSSYLLRIYLKLIFIALFFPFTAKVFVSRAFSDTQHRYILNEL